MGKWVTFINEKFYIQDGGEVIAHGTMENGLYNMYLELETSYSPEKSRFVNPTALVGKDKVSADTWHKRLGHLGSGSMLKLIKNGMVEGIDLAVGSVANLKDICESCLAGKQVSSKFKNLQLPRSSG